LKTCGALLRHPEQMRTLSRVNLNGWTLHLLVCQAWIFQARPDLRQLHHHLPTKPVNTNTNIDIDIINITNIVRMKQGNLTTGIVATDHDTRKNHKLMPLKRQDPMQRSMP